MLDCESPAIHQKRWYELLKEVVQEYKSLKISNVRIDLDSRYDEKKCS